MELVLLIAVFYLGLLIVEQRLAATVKLAGLALLLILADNFLPAPVTLIFWVVLIIAATVALLPLLRAAILKRLLPRLRTRLPRLSTTEQEALEAGTVWWDGELFSGRPDWEKLLAQPAAVLTEEEQAFLDGPVEELIHKVDEWQVYQRRSLTQATWNFMKNHGFFALVIPPEYGGKGFSAYAHSCVVMKLASHSVTTAVTVMVPNSLGPAELLMHYGTDEQRDYWLPRLADGSEVPCFALTGPVAGSDAGSIPDLGVVCRGEYGGEEQLGIRLKFSKRYITLAPVATVIGLAFKMVDPDHLLGEREELGITVALVPADTPGVRQGERHNPLGLAFQNGPLYGEDVFVPLSAIIGGEQGIGRGWRMLVESLAEGRGISLPALATGSGKVASRYTGAYARIREQFGLPIGRFEGVAELLGRIAGLTYTMDAARELTCSAIGQGEKPAVVTAILKYHLTESMRQVINDAMDIHGGSGIMFGPRNLVGPIYQAVPVAITVEGANILTRNLIIFGQGAVRAHPWLLQEMAALAEENEDVALGQLDEALRGHVEHTFGNLARSFRLGLSKGYFSTVPAHPLSREIQRMNWLSAAFAVAADVALLVMGGDLKRRENLSARLGDVLSQLYLASAVVKRFSDQGRKFDDLPVARWAMTHALYEGENALLRALDNFPQRWLGWLVKRWVGPVGRVCPPVDDLLQRQVAETLLQPSECRDRLTAGICRDDSGDSQRGRLERAFTLSVPVESLQRQLREWQRSGELPADASEDELVQQALKQMLIDADQADSGRQYRQLQQQIIQVDSFDGRQLANP